MIVDGMDHDLLMLAYTFHLYGDDWAEECALAAARYKDPAEPAIDGPGLIAKLVAAGYSCILEDGDADIAYAAAEAAWRKGWPALVRVFEPSHCDTPCWHLYLGQRDGHMLTVCQDARPDPPPYGASAPKALCGEAIVILTPIRHQLVALQQRLSA
jgi:hypothetical protein